MVRKKRAIERATQELFGESAEAAVPRLMHEHRAPHRVAALLNVAPNSVRFFLTTRGWVFDGDNWVAPEVEPEHA